MWSGRWGTRCVIDESVNVGWHTRVRQPTLWLQTSISHSAFPSIRSLAVHRMPQAFFLLFFVSFVAFGVFLSRWFSKRDIFFHTRSRVSIFFFFFYFTSEWIETKKSVLFVRETWGWLHTHVPMGPTRFDFFASHSLRAMCRSVDTATGSTWWK